MEGLAMAAVPATCGELVQGTLEGIPCLVSCPIDCYSIAQVNLRPVRGWQVPRDAPKAVAALHAGLAYLGGTEWGGRLWLTADLPRGRGYGSSTADIGATLYALGGALGQSLAPERAAWLAVGVEPSDSSLFPGMALFDHRGASFYELLGPAPDLDVVVVDPGGAIDTLAFNRVDYRPALQRLAGQHREAFSLLRQGLQCGDWRAVGQAATISARAHQAILPNPLLEPTLALAQAVGALGVCRGHSGTLLGLLLDRRHADAASAAAFVAGRLPGPVTVTPYAMVDGGPRYSLGINQLLESETCKRPALAKG